MTHNIWYMTNDKWHMKQISNYTFHTWHMTHEIWCMIYDTWRMMHDDDDDDSDDDIYIMVRCLSRKCLLFVQKICSFLTFIATFRTQRNWSFPCFLTHSVLKGIGRFHVSWLFCIQRIWSFLMFIDTFRIQKCLETVKRQNPSRYSKNLVKSPVSGHFPYSKVSRKSKTTKSLEVFKEFGQFSCF